MQDLLGQVFFCLNNQFKFYCEFERFGILMDFLRKINALKSIIYYSECKNPLIKVNYKRNIDGKTLRCYKTDT